MTTHDPKAHRCVQTGITLSEPYIKCECGFVVEHIYSRENLVQAFAAHYAKAVLEPIREWCDGLTAKAKQQGEKGYAAAEMATLGCRNELRALLPSTPTSEVEPQ